MEQELFENIKIFLEKEKGCSNVESEAPIQGMGLEQKKFGRMDVAGGKFYNEEKRTYSCIELHCVEYKSEQDDIIKGIGQLFWYKFGMSEIYLWVERLFLYLLIDEHRVYEEHKTFCKSFGFGLLQVNPTKIITEVVTPENQNSFVARMAQEKEWLICPECHKSLSPKEFRCPQCGIELEANAFWNLFADRFQSASGNPRYKGVPDHAPSDVQETPLLRKVFANWSKVQEAWKVK